MCRADVGSWYQLTAPDNDGPLRVSVCERSKWKDGIRNKKERPGVWKSSPPIWMFARASFKGFPSFVYLRVTIFREDPELCEKKKKTTFELREEKGPYLFFGKELAVFKSHPRHYFKDHRWAFLCRRIQKSQSASFFFFFYPIPKVIMHSAITAFLRFLQWRDLRVTFSSQTNSSSTSEENSYSCYCHCNLSSQSWISVIFFA